MNRAYLTTVSCVLALVILAPSSVAGQDSTWVVPRTPWGHPDLQGIWTTDAEIGVPFERPVERGEQALLTDQEFAARAAALGRKYQDDKADRKVRSGSTEAGPEHWYEGGAKVSRRTSLIIDPPHGRMPEYTAEAKQRVVPKGTEINVGGSNSGGPFDGPEDLHLADRCITRGLPHTWLTSEYNNGFQIVQSADHVVDEPLDFCGYRHERRQLLADLRVRVS